MRRCPALWWALSLLAGAVAVAGSGPGPERSVLFQTGSPFRADSDLRAGTVLLASDEGPNGLKSSAERLRSWRDAGYSVYGFASLARVYDYYMRGGWTEPAGHVDPGGHEGEIQTDRWGAHFGPHQYMLLPNERLTEHKKLWARAFVQAGAGGMLFEEPDVFADGGYEPQFRKEWEAQYHEPWLPPQSSLLARVRSERLKAELVRRSYAELSRYCKSAGGNQFRFGVASHSLPGYLLWGVSSSYWDVLSLPSVDIWQAQVWTGTARTPVLHNGRLEQRLFENAYLDYSYSVNLAEALHKEVWLNMDPYEDEPGLPFDLYRRGFENTLVASMLFPQAKRWEILPWPERIYANRRIPPEYGTEIQNVISAMAEIGRAGDTRWAKPGPRIGVLFSETAAQEARDPNPANPQTLFALGVPLLRSGLPVDVVPVEAAGVRSYLDRFRVLVLSYDAFKPRSEDLHRALADWVRRGGHLILLGGRSAYNAVPSWWRSAGFDSPPADLLARVGVGDGKTRLVPQHFRDLDAGIGGAPLRALFAGQRGVDHLPRPVSFRPNGDFPERNYLDTVIAPGESRGDLRFADRGGFFTYRFETEGLRALLVTADLGNSYLVESSRDGSHWRQLAAAGNPPSPPIRDGSNRGEVGLDLTPDLPAARLYLRFRDPTPNDGWGPTLRRMSLQPRGPVAASDPPLNHRDAYCIGYTGVRPGVTVLLKGRDGVPVAFQRRCGQGDVLVIGAPPALFGSSADCGDELVRRVRSAAGLGPASDGALHLQRGRFHLVSALHKPAALAGRYLDVLSADLSVLNNPVVAVDQPRLLLQLSAPTAVPGLVFGSQEATASRVGRRLELTVRGPEGIPFAARISFHGSLRITASRLRDNQPVAVEVRTDVPDLPYLRLPNQAGGVRVRIE